MAGPGRRHETGLPAGLSASVERSLLELLNAEIARRFNPDASEDMGLSIGFRFVMRWVGMVLRARGGGPPHYCFADMQLGAALAP